METNKHLKGNSEKNNNKNNIKVTTRHKETNFKDASVNCFM